jgi:DNA uptake protein ComE-like DNA-binding protein
VLSGSVRADRLARRHDVVQTFTNEAEQTAYNLAEALADKAMSFMRSAEESAKAFQNGRIAMRRQFKSRGLSEAEADIRYAGTVQASRAIAENSFCMSQASMYNTAAATQYAKALYLKSR